MVLRSWWGRGSHAEGSFSRGWNEGWDANRLPSAHVSTYPTVSVIFVRPVNSNVLCKVEDSFLGCALLIDVP